MAVWAIGDIQGCYASLQALLRKIDFDPTRDTLWVAGDLVNRGSDSLATLRYLYRIRHAVKIVLGNHDITLIAIYYGLKKSNPTLDPILEAEDGGLLVDWLRSQPFLQVDYQLGYCMAHAGISPEFDLGMAIRYARRVEEKLQSDHAKVWLKKMFKQGITRFNRDASKIDIDRYIVSAFTRMRYCYNDSRLDFDQKGAPTQALREKGLKPWFESQERKPLHLKVIFGHWSTLGLHQADGVLALDTGCLWGGSLTAARIDSDHEEIISVTCEGV